MASCPIRSAEFGRHYNPELRRLEALRAIPLLMLLGEPGAGKSTLLQDEADALAAAGQAVHSLRLNEYSSADLVPEAFRLASACCDWRRGADRLYLLLDGLDECL
jgi:predicted NACHT family NTPase